MHTTTPFTPTDRKHQRAFTIVELVVIVAVIGVLATVASISFSKIRQNQRDDQRTAQVATVADSLEKYYERNGEYPPATALSSSVAGNSGAVVSDKFSLPARALVMPGAPKGTTNSIVATNTPTPTSISYQPKSPVNPASCQRTDGGCDEFTLQYAEEASGDTITINSRHSGRPVESIEYPVLTPGAPVAKINSSGATTVWSWVAATCANGSAEYSYKLLSSIGDSGFSPATTATTASNTTTSQGVTYGIAVRQKCKNGPSSSDWGPNSNNPTYTSPILAPTAPAAPTARISSSGATTVWTWTAASCSSGTPEYRYQLLSTAGNGSFSANTTALSNSRATAAQGVTYGIYVQQSCKSSAGASGWSGNSNNPTYTSPILPPNAPDAPTARINSSGTTTVWAWTAAGCSAGAPEYRYQFLSSVGNSGYSAYTKGLSASNTTSSQGVNYGIYVQQRCINAGGASDWSGNSNNPTYFADIVHAQVLAAGMRIVSGPAAQFRPSTTDRGCASGLTLQMAWRTSKNDSDWPAWSGTTYYDYVVKQTVQSGASVGTDTKLEFSARTRCYNKTTDKPTGNRGDDGGVGVKYDYGNIYYRTGNVFNINCQSPSFTTYCEAGYSSRNVRGTGLLNCTVRTSDPDQSNSWSKEYPINSTDMRCWPS